MAQEEYIQNAKLLPVNLTLCFYSSLTSGENVLIDVMKKQMPDRWVTLRKAWVTQNSNVALYAYRNGMNRVEAETASLLSVNYPNEFEVVNTKRFKVSLHADANVSGYVSRFNCWIYRPTIADKILHGMVLTDEENSIAEELDIFNLINKGRLPLPWDYVLERRLHVVDKWTTAILEDLTTSGLEYSYLSYEDDKFLVLEMLAGEDTSGTTTNANITITSDDYTTQVINLPAMNVAVDIPMFIPATSELVVSFDTDVNYSNFNARWRIAECKLDDWWAMQFGLLTREDDEDLWKEVKAGL